MVLMSLTCQASTVLVGNVVTPFPRAIAQQMTANGDAVIAWNANAGVAATQACIAPLDSPFHESRLYAPMHIAVHDALNAIDRRFCPYIYDKPAAVGHCRRRRSQQLPVMSSSPCLSRFRSNSLPSVETDYTAALAAIAYAPAKAQGIAVGQGAAQVIIALHPDNTMAPQIGGH